MLSGPGRVGIAEPHARRAVVHPAVHRRPVHRQQRHGGAERRAFHHRPRPNAQRSRDHAYAAPAGFWANSLTLRYDTGLVANPSDPVEVARDADYSDLLPYVILTSAPPRVKPRTVLDMALGYEHKRGERRVWEVSVEVANLTNQRALYNFQSMWAAADRSP